MALGGGAPRRHHDTEDDALEQIFPHLERAHRGRAAGHLFALRVRLDRREDGRAGCSP